MDTTLSIRVDRKIKDEAEKLFESMGLSMSAAMRLFLQQVIAKKALPFSVKALDADDLEYPLHVYVEVMGEKIAVISARLQDMELAEKSPAKRRELQEVGKALRAMRFQFDPYSADEVMAMVEQVNVYADKILGPGRSAASAASA